MDLVGALSSQLGMDETQAKGLAGGLLGVVKSGLANQVSPEAAAQLENAVPEMNTWQTEGDTPEGEPGVTELLGGLLGGGGGGGDGGGALGGLIGGLASSALGGGGASGAAGMAGAIAGLVQRFGLDGSKAAIAGGLVANFLEDKLDPQLLAQAKPMMALLSGGGDGDGGGIAGMLGGLLS